MGYPHPPHDKETVVLSQYFGDEVTVFLNDCVCPVDLDASGVVDFGDLPFFQAAFFSLPGDPNWNPHADLNGDEVVDFGDLPTIQSLFFGPPGPSGLVP